MFSHVTIGSNDLARAGRFYDVVLATLEVKRRFSNDRIIAYQASGKDTFCIVVPFDGERATTGNGVHVAFFAPTRSHVDAFHAAALASGGTDEGAPGLRPHYHEHYYGAYARDPDGNKIQAVCHRPE